jgi:zinc finger protein ubi-d4
MALKVSSPPAELNIKMTNILKIENFLNDQSYSDLIEYSANFNARLCIERRLRMPFLDPQTGVAQKHSNLFMKASQRLPGLKDGQVYTYPNVQRWRCKKSSVKFNSRPFYRFRNADNCTTVVTPSSNLLPPATSSVIAPPIASTEGGVSDFQALIDAESNSLGAADTDSKDSQIVKDEPMSKDWFFEDMDANDVNSEEQGDSDFDYNINGYKRKKKQVTAKKSSRKPKDSNASENVKKRSSSGAPSSNRNNRSRKSSSRSKSGKSENASRNFADVEPPSFDSVQGDLFDGNSTDKFGAYRNF